MTKKSLKMSIDGKLLKMCFKGGKGRSSTTVTGSRYRDLNLGVKGNDSIPERQRPGYHCHQHGICKIMINSRSAVDNKP